MLTLTAAGTNSYTVSDQENQAYVDMQAHQIADLAISNTALVDSAKWMVTKGDEHAIFCGESIFGFSWNTGIGVYEMDGAK